MKSHKSCRVCGSTNLKLVLDLGPQPPSNNFVDNPHVEEEKFPLRVFFCKECYLIQLIDVVEPEDIFNNNYPYFTGKSSQTTIKYFHDLAKRLEKFYKLDKEKIVVDIGGNDGTFLDGFTKPLTINVEPCIEQAKISEKKGHVTFNKFFTPEVARDIVDNFGRVDIVTATNMMAHVDDLYTVMSGIRYLLKPYGIFVLENHYAHSVFFKGQYDSIYHEHMSYFSQFPLDTLAKAFGMGVTNMEYTPAHGGSIRVYFTDTEFTNHYTLYTSLFQNVKDYSALVMCGKKMLESGQRLKKLLKKLKSKGKTIVGYGCPAKANTIINSFDIGEELDFMIDTTPSKQGKYTPGSHVPIFHPDIFKETKVDYAVMFPWNYKEEILRKEKEWLRSGGKFIIPIPEPKIIGGVNV